MSTTKNTEQFNRGRRRFFGEAAVMLAAAELATLGSADAQSDSAHPSHVPPVTRGTNASFASIKQINAGLLNIGYAEAGPADGPASACKSACKSSGSSGSASRSSFCRTSAVALFDGSVLTPPTAVSETVTSCFVSATISMMFAEAICPEVTATSRALACCIPLNVAETE